MSRIQMITKMTKQAKDNLMKQKKTLETILARIMRIAAILAHHDNPEAFHKPNSANKPHQKHNGKHLAGSFSCTNYTISTKRCRVNEATDDITR